MTCPNCKKEAPPNREMCPGCGYPVRPIPVPPGGPARYNPIHEDDIIGTVEYTLDGRVILVADLISLDTVLERTRESDMDFRIQQFKDMALSVQAIPLYAGIFLVLVTLILLARAGRKRKKNRNSFGLNRRY